MVCPTDDTPRELGPQRPAMVVPQACELRAQRRLELDASEILRATGYAPADDGRQGEGG